MKSATSFLGAIAWASGLGCGLIACVGQPDRLAIGDDAAEPSTSDGGESPGRDVTGSNHLSAPSGRAPWCPGAIPAAGTPCTAPTAPTSYGSVGTYGDCTYGAVSSPCAYGGAPHCTTFATCSPTDSVGHGVWAITPPPSTCNGNPPSCPGDFATASGATCDSLQTSCMYGAGSCACTPCGPACNDTCSPDASADFVCRPWPADPSCPDPAPLLGTACNTEGQTCSAEANQPSPSPSGLAWTLMLCAGGYWRSYVGACGGC